jgi:hypothetical protein
MGPPASSQRVFIRMAVARPRTRSAQMCRSCPDWTTDLLDGETEPPTSGKCGQFMFGVSTIPTNDTTPGRFATTDVGIFLL